MCSLMYFDLDMFYFVLCAWKLSPVQKFPTGVLSVPISFSDKDANMDLYKF